MRCEWKKVKISDVCKICYGKDHKQLLDGNVPAYGSGGIIRRVNKSIHEKKSVLIPRKGSLDNLFFADPPFWTVDTLFWTDIDETKINPAFFFYQLKTLDLASKNVGTAVPSLTTSVLNDIEINLPSMNIQKQIAAILSALDEKIAINRAINENLERQAQALFKSWFVDFDSVSKLGFTESELGDIPYGWRIYTLSEFLPVKTGKKNANVSSDKGAYPFFSCSQDFSWTDEYSFEGHAILVAGNGDFNVKWYNGKFEAYQRTYVLIPYVERYTDWLYYAVKYNLESITSAARGSVIKFITKGNLENFAFAAPENLEKCEIIDIFSSINRIIDALTQENYRLAEIRDSLLPKLMAGEIDASAVQL